MIKDVFKKTYANFKEDTPLPKTLNDAFPKKSETKKLNVLLLSTTASAWRWSEKDKENKRRSTSDWSLKQIQQHFKDNRPDVSTVLVRLADLRYTPCEGNYSREKNLCSWPCQISLRKEDDQLNILYYALVDWADVIIVGTPIRYGQPSALYYKMVERLTCIHNQLTLNDHNLILDKVAAFVITGGQDNVQQVAGQMLLFWSEIGFTFAGHAYVGWSRGWNNEKMGTNWDEMIHNEQFKTDLLRMANDAVEMKERLDQAPLSLDRKEPTSYSEYVIRHYLESQNKIQKTPPKFRRLKFGKEYEKITEKGARYTETQWEPCKIEHIPDGSLKMFNVEGKHIAVINYKNEIHAFDGICTHARVQLEEGPLIPVDAAGSKVIYCTAHYAKFDPISGKIKNQENFIKKYNCMLRDLNEYKVRFDKDGIIEVEC
jgi:nitrite reductase/ring-hydroxylating ferredoxin subunit/multimeric flavodoxin WrbA